MAEEEKLFYSIGEVAQIVDVKPYVLRYWETEFRKLNPQKSVTGQRTYRQRDLRVALTIKRLLYEEQYTIAGAIKKLEELDEKQGLDPLENSATPVLLQSEQMQPSSSEELAPEENPLTHQKDLSPTPSFSPPREKVLELKNLISSTQEILKKHNLAPKERD
jgi:DNA-binding transcriptional MerR regulator